MNYFEWVLLHLIAIVVLLFFFIRVEVVFRCRFRRIDEIRAYWIETNIDRNPYLIDLYGKTDPKQMILQIHKWTYDQFYPVTVREYVESALAQDERS